MGIVKLEELEVNFTNAFSIPDSDIHVFPFGYADENIVHYTEDIVVENIIPGYLAISSNSRLARQLQHVAQRYNCSDIRKYDKIFLPNPNGYHTHQPCTLVRSLYIYFIGIACKDHSYELQIKIV